MGGTNREPVGSLTLTYSNQAQNRPRSVSEQQLSDVSPKPGTLRPSNIHPANPAGYAQTREWKGFPSRTGR